MHIIHLHVYTHVGARVPAPPRGAAAGADGAPLDSKRIRLRVSNPRSILSGLPFEMPSGGSNLPGAGPIFPDWTLTTGRNIILALINYYLV